MELINKVLAFFQGHMVESIVAFLFLVVEYWLGKTDVVKPGSTLEVVLSTIKKVLGLIGKVKDAVVGKKA